MSKTPSRLVAALVATAVTLSMTAPAEARLGGGKSSSSSSVSRSSSSSYSSGSSSYSSGSSSRVGGGSASGMQRPEVMDRVRSGQTAQPAPSAQPGYAAPAAPVGAPAQQGSGSWVKPALAGAAVGAVAGYAISEATRPDAPVAHGGGGAAAPAAPMDSGASAGNGYSPGYGAPAHQSSGGGMWLWLLVGLLGAGAFYMWRRNSAQPRAATAGSSPYAAGGTAAYRTAAPTGGTGGFGPEAEELQRFAPAFFKTMQDLNNGGDTDGLRKYTTPMMFEQLRVDIDQRGGARANTQVIDMRGEIVDFTRNGDGAQIASVRFRGHVSESADTPAETVDEVWHLLREQGDGWRLAGIEQV